jgi:hypothetical protein
LSDKDSSAISQAEIDKIKNRYEAEEQRLKALEDLQAKTQQYNKEVNNKKQPLAVGGSSTPIAPINNNKSPPINQETKRIRYTIPSSHSTQNKRSKSY